MANSRTILEVDSIMSTTPAEHKTTRTTLSVFREVFGWHDGTTIEQAWKRLAVASLEELDRLCTRLAAEVDEISDPREALRMIKHRNGMIRLRYAGIGAIPSGLTTSDALPPRTGRVVLTQAGPES